MGLIEDLQASVDAQTAVINTTASTLAQLKTDFDTFADVDFIGEINHLEGLIAAAGLTPEQQTAIQASIDKIKASTGVLSGTSQTLTDLQTKLASIDAVAKVEETK